MDDYVAKPFTLAEIARVCAIAAGLEAQDIPSGPSDGRRAPSAEDFGNEPLLAPETLAMFATISGASGRAMASRIFTLFAAHAPRGLRDLADAIEERDPDTASVAHALKSMCSSAGARRAAVICQAIEDRARSGRPVEPVYVGALEDTVTETLAEMQQWTVSGTDSAEAAAI